MHKKSVGLLFSTLALFPLLLLTSAGVGAQGLFVAYIMIGAVGLIIRIALNSAVPKIDTNTFDKSNSEITSEDIDRNLARVTNAHKKVIDNKEQVDISTSRSKEVLDENIGDLKVEFYETFTNILSSYSNNDFENIKNYCGEKVSSFLKAEYDKLDKKDGKPILKDFEFVDCIITDTMQINDIEEVHCSLTISFHNYVVSKTDDTILRGFPQIKEKKTYSLIFKRTEGKELVCCPHCSARIDHIVTDGICDYCHKEISKAPEKFVLYKMVTKVGGEKKMELSELIEKDKTFNESMFITKIDNILVKLLTSVMLDELDTVDHFISDEVYAKYKNMIDIYTSKGERKMYDELNISKTNIDSVDEDENYYYINTSITCKYLDYVLNLDSGDVVRGDNQDRIYKTFKLVFAKSKGAMEQGVSRYCPGCGHPLNVNESGKCAYCGSIYNQEDFDWVLSSIDE